MLLLFLGAGKGLLNFPSAYIVGAGSCSIAAADLNGDSNPDLIVGSRSKVHRQCARYPKRKPAGSLAHPLDGWLPSSMMPLGAIIFRELAMTSSSSIPPSRSG